jgi:hypothetical protein
MTADVLLGDIVERPTRRYLVTKVLNMWEVSMAGSHSIKFGRSKDKGTPSEIDYSKTR